MINMLIFIFIVLYLISVYYFVYLCNKLKGEVKKSSLYLEYSNYKYPLLGRNIMEVVPANINKIFQIRKKYIIFIGSQQCDYCEKEFERFRLFNFNSVVPFLQIKHDINNQTTDYYINRDSSNNYPVINADNNFMEKLKIDGYPSYLVVGKYGEILDYVIYTTSIINKIKEGLK